MKNLSILLISMLLLSPLVLAQRNSGNTGPNDTGKPEVTPGDGGTPRGLAVALTKVQNENARQRLQANINKFQENYQQRLQKMEDVEIEEVDEETGAVKMKAKEPVKYLGFINGKATKRFNINAEGKIEEKTPWYKFLYSDTFE